MALYYLVKEWKMKRKGYLYYNMYKLKNIEDAYNEVCKNTKNKRKVYNYKQYKCIYITRVYNILKNKEYKVGKYNIFYITDPKPRRIVSQGIQDKIVNHLVSRQILYPALLPCLIDENVASRKGKGTKEGLRLFYEFQRKCKIKYHDYYILKCDISKFFSSINQDILKEKLRKKIKDKDALKIVFDIIDSEEMGLGIGNMTSQILAIFYLNDFDHFVKERLNIKYYVRYQDDFLLFHQSKAYLRFCLEEIKKFLKNEKLTLNNKTRLYNSNNNFIFLGRNKYGRYARYRTIRKRLKIKKYHYENKKIPLSSLVTSYICYQNLEKKSGKTI